jgi:hypothetical protein
MGADELDRPPQDIVRSWVVISRVKSVLTSSVIENIQAGILSERLLDEVIDPLVQLRIIKSSASDVRQADDGGRLEQRCRCMWRGSLAGGPSRLAPCVRSTVVVTG